MESSQTKRKFVYKPKQKNGMVLLTFKKEADLSKNSHPATLSQYNWNKKFTVNKLHNVWKEKADKDFQINEQKFPFNIVKQEVLEAKQYVKELIENDVLEIKKKRWNVSSTINAKDKKDHKKSLFELKHGLVSFSSTPKQRKKKRMMTISTNDFDIINDTKSNTNDRRWNIKATLEPEDKLKLCNRIKYSAKLNSKTYWKEHCKTSNTIGDAYTSPYDKFTNDSKLLKKIKEDTELKREEIEKEVRYSNPGAINYPEKINALVYKEMKEIYKSKLNKIKLNHIDNSNDSSVNANATKKKQYCDTEIIEKIARVKEWKENDRNKYSLFQTEVNVQNYLIPLVTHSNQIQNKEKEMAIKNKKDNEIESKKMRISAQALTNYNNYHNNQSNQTYSKPQSRYPINEYLLEDSKKNINFFSETFEKKPITEGCSNATINDNSKNSNFISIYKEISTVAVKSNINKTEKYNQKYHEIGNHTGTYRIFKNDKGKDYYAWSCCMKEDKMSQGCHRLLERKNKWNFY